MNDSSGGRIPGSPIIVALDVADARAALALAGRLDPQLCRVKVGKELFTRAGPAVVEQLQHAGFEVFLDLKFHDIPNTVAQALRAAADLGVWMVNVHASGGRRMLEAAVQAMTGCRRPPLLIGVTVLTSMDESDFAELGYTETVAERVLRLATLTASAGLDGVVCSAQEAPSLRRACGDAFALVTPGIRTSGGDAGDQRRVVTPAAALELGSDYLVIGRSVTSAADPVTALNAIIAELSVAAG
ncbi:MAG: orotidine-5'-phosphate decarboxylase [Chromatocurvus sp.]